MAIPPMTEEYGAKVSPMSERLVAYCWSLAPYFNDPSQVNPGLLKLKVMELLYNVMDCSKNSGELRQLAPAIHQECRGL